MTQSEVLLRQFACVVVISLGSACEQAPLAKPQSTTVQRERRPQVVVEDSHSSQVTNSASLDGLCETPAPMDPECPATQIWNIDQREVDRVVCPQWCDCRIDLPTEGFRRLPRFEPEGGSFVDLMRSVDGRTVWLALYANDGSELFFRFSTSEALPMRGTGELQFVDGLFQMNPNDNHCVNDRVLGIGYYAPYERLAEAWLLAADRSSMIRPSTGEAFPIVPVPDDAHVDVNTVQRMIFTNSHPKHPRGCVLVGEEPAVTTKYLEYEDPTRTQGLWIFPW